MNVGSVVYLEGMTLIRLQARLTRARRRARNMRRVRDRGDVRDVDGVSTGLSVSNPGQAVSNGRGIPRRHAREDTAQVPPSLVPWQIERDRNSQVTALTNISDRDLRHVRLVLCGGTQLAITLPVLVTPGQRLAVWGDNRIAGVVAAPDAMWVVRWVTDTNQELLWPIPAV